MRKTRETKKSAEERMSKILRVWVSRLVCALVKGMAGVVTADFSEYAGLRLPKMPMVRKIRLQKLIRFNCQLDTWPNARKRTKRSLPSERI